MLRIGYVVSWVVFYGVKPAIEKSLVRSFLSSLPVVSQNGQPDLETFLNEKQWGQRAGQQAWRSGHMLGPVFWWNWMESDGRDVNVNNAAHCRDSPKIEGWAQWLKGRFLKFWWFCGVVGKNFIVFRGVCRLCDS